MAQTQSRISDTGSNYSFHRKIVDPRVKRSRFNTSYTNYFTARQGLMYPFYVQFFQPGEDYELSVSNFIRVINPPTVPLLSRQRVFFHYFAVTMPQIWKQFQVFMTKGRNGTVNGTVPLIRVTGTAADVRARLGRGTLYDYLIGALPYNVQVAGANEQVTVEFSALPFMAYQRIFRDYFLNQRLNNSQTVANPRGSDEVWFPYDDADFRLDGLNLVADRYGYASGDTGFSFNVDLTLLRWRNYADDYFTSSLLSPQLGEEASVEQDVSGDVSVTGGIYADGERLKLQGLGPSNYPDVFSAGTDVLNQSSSENSYLDFLSAQGFGGNGGSYLGPFGSANFIPQIVGSSDAPYNSRYIGGDPDNVTVVRREKDINVSAQGTFSGASVGLTTSQVRELLVLSRIQEKHARIDGSYSDYLRTFFDSRPRSAQDFRPVYIGGSYQPVLFSEVLQTSESSNTPLGTVGGKGVSSNNDGIGRYHSDDYGFIIGLMSIVPDTIYSTGVNRTMLYRKQEDFPLPERTDLGMQPVYNAELFVSGNSGVDMDLYGYQDRFDELRYRANEIHGKFGDPDNFSFSPYTQYRKLTSTPTLTQSFVTLEDNINNDWLTVADEDSYGCQVFTRVNVVKPLPYQAVPLGLL